MLEAMQLSGELDKIIIGALGDKYNALYYGMDNTGKVDISFALKKLADDGIGFLFFPAGTYLIDKNVSLENISLVGEKITGENCTKFIMNGTITVNNISNDGVKEIKNIKFEGNETIENILILGNGTWGCRCEIANCQFINFNYTAIKTLSNFSTRFINCLFQDNGKETNIGVNLTSNGTPTEQNFNNEISFENCYFNNGYNTKNSIGVLLDNVRGVSFKNTSFEWCKTAIAKGNLSVRVACDTCWFEALTQVFDSTVDLTCFNNCIVYTTDYLFKNETNINDGYTIPKINGATLSDAMKNAKDFLFTYRERLRYSVNNKYYNVIEEGFSKHTDYRPKNKLEGTKLTKSIFYDTTNLKNTGLTYLVIATARKTFSSNTSTALAYGLVSKDFVIGLDSVVKNSNASENSNILNIGFQADGVSLSLIDGVDPDFESCIFIPLSI